MDRYEKCKTCVCNECKSTDYCKRDCDNCVNADAYKAECQHQQK